MIAPLLDYIESAKRREIGMEAAANGYGADTWLQEARRTAEMLAARYGEVRITDVLKLCPRPEAVSVNATGSVMRSKRLKLVRYESSHAVQAHARKIGVYIYND